jgi:hypothetical protein
MYWLYGANKVASPNVPAYTAGTTLDYTLTLVAETGDGLTNAYLAVLQPAHAGLIQAKRHTDATYQNIEMIGYPVCWLNTIPDGTSVAIDFRISLPLGTPDGLYAPAVVVAYGDDVEPPNPYYGGTDTRYYGSDRPDYYGD